jgi:hypothetical protein
METEIAVARDFTRYPGPRYRNSGPYSGEQFRDEVLVPKLREAISVAGRVIVDLDDVAGYGSSFLEETFGGLVRLGFSKEELDEHLIIVARSPQFRHHAVRAREYIEEAAGRSLALAH